MTPHVHPITIYYEDTDFSGFVYHANYLKYFERAREELLGVRELVALWRDDGIGFVVYRADLSFKEPAVHGDRLEIHTTVELGSEYRCSFDQRVFREGGAKPLVVAAIELVCVSRAGKLVALPERVVARLRA